MTNKNKIKKAIFSYKIKRIGASIILIMIMGVFLFPGLSYASIINDENIINITNKTRIEEGLNPLTANQLLSKAAYDKAEAIFSTKKFAHTLNNKKFSTWIKEAGYQYKSVGENLAIDFITSEGAMRAWLKSPSHKKNILNPKFQEIGVAVKSDKFSGHEATLVVQIFGTPAILSNQLTAIKPAKPNKTKAKNNYNQAMFLDNSLHKTSLVMKTKYQINSGYLPPANQLYGQDYLSQEFITRIAVYITDSQNINLLKYYFGIIILLFLVFSSSYTWKKQIYLKN